MWNEDQLDAHNAVLRREHVEAPKQRTTFLTVMESAALLRVSRITLGRWRIEGRAAMNGQKSRHRTGRRSHRYRSVQPAHRTN